MATYRIVRFFMDPAIDNQVIAEGLSLEDAQEYCNDPETSASTCTAPFTVAIAEKFGPWFDGYEEE